MFVLEQEMASIIKFVLNRAGNPAPYYWEVPTNFIVPSIYFPMPELDTGGETFLTYNVDYSWYIKIFHKTKEEAYSIGIAVINSIRAGRNLIPLIKSDGSETDGKWVRLNDPNLKLLDAGAAQLTIDWRRRKPYNDAEAQRAQSFNVDMFIRSGKEISNAYAEVIERYAVPLNSNN